MQSAIDSITYFVVVPTFFILEREKNQTNKCVSTDIGIVIANRDLSIAIDDREVHECLFPLI